MDEDEGGSHGVCNDAQMGRTTARRARGRQATTYMVDNESLKPQLEARLNDMISRDPFEVTDSKPSFPK